MDSKKKESISYQPVGSWAVIEYVTAPDPPVAVAVTKAVAAEESSAMVAVVTENVIAPTENIHYRDKYITVRYKSYTIIYVRL